MMIIRRHYKDKSLDSNIFEFLFSILFQTASPTAKTQSVVQTHLIAQKSNIVHLYLNLVGQATKGRLRFGPGSSFSSTPKTVFKSTPKNGTTTKGTRTIFIINSLGLLYKSYLTVTPVLFGDEWRQRAVVVLAGCGYRETTSFMKGSHFREPMAISTSCPIAKLIELT